MAGVDILSNNFDNFCDDDLWAMLDNSVNDNDKNYNISNGCIACLSVDIFFDSFKSIHICNSCGAEFGEVLDNRPERNNTENGDVSRCGAVTNEFCPEAAMATNIGGSYGLLAKIHTWYNGIGYKQRARLEVLKQLEYNMKKHNITRAIIHSAKHYYKEISEMKHTTGPNIGEPIIIRGINRQTLIAACAFYGAKIQKSPRTSDEIAEIFNLPTTKVNEGIRKFREILQYDITTYEFKPVLAEDFIERFCCKLALKRCHIDIATKIARNIQKLNISPDHKATSIAAGSIYIMTTLYNLDITKKRISEEYGISEVTINKTCKELYKYRKILISDSLSNKTLEKINKKINDNPNILNTNKNNINDIFLNINHSDITNNTEQSSSSINTIDLNNIVITEKKKRGRPKKNI